MKSILGTTVALAVTVIFVSSTQAFNVTSATVLNGFAIVEGNQATRRTLVVWEGSGVADTTARGNFNFSFGAVPSDCVGELIIGADTVLVSLTNCTPTPPEPTGGVLLKTGQTTSFATGDDGDLEKGAASPNPRFTVNVNAAADSGAGGGTAGNGICDGTEICNGTITDNLTGLIWLRDGSCIGVQTWANALTAANTLGDGNVACDLSDGSIAGAWRLPNLNELFSLINLGTFNPALPVDHRFTNFQTNVYWSSTTGAGGTAGAWFVHFNTGILGSTSKTSSNVFVIVVRDGS